ncbi:PREDICTED: 46 kDa FK506-binding nuclear protein-like [Dinoponera quadriceps]|uniref:FK506-binding protein n=1 Tax=Dinoponera quadriceps TaxID=609295 RepID=A0A6P3Y5V3_DINQU|nr:PREDICTED: 46 kDa FK506-binding nuclear protein-like [Dinoponera quadriceps]
MFWGLIMEPNKWYSQVVENSFHVSMASLDVETADDGIVQVILCYGDRNYLLCSLKKNSTWQVPLDLNFQEGTKIAFTCNGEGHVHLTGYMIMDENTDDFDKYEDESENEQEEVQVNKKLPKRKATESPKEEKELKRLKQLVEAESSDDDDIEEDGIDQDDAEDSDDEDNMQEIEDDDDDDNDEEEEEEEEEDNDDEEDDEDEEDEEDEEENKMQIQRKPTKQPQQHENKKKQTQEQQQPKKKHDNQKLINGKEVRSEQQSKQQKKNKVEQAQLHQQNAQKEAKKRVVEGGVLVEDKKIGNGAVAQSGKFVAVYSVGRLKNGKKIDSTLEGEGFKFRLGKGEVIRGWDVGIAGMKIGGKRRITIPPNMAYGAKGSPPVIPGNSTLIFDIELRKVY